ncbi:hypothetical protein KIN20_016405 [Parelaphostrongylus tenuis]|uniref:Uncharacterized protein n=1 Tax=Parelaphostrongylus tenuis TaxID=148309 RepID=A0AAD5MGF2_PARTN|nr:hypothetical protein KIN20_016405 [Parelaphostrongylus tenuis]
MEYQRYHETEKREDYEYHARVESPSYHEQMREKCAESQRIPSAIYGDGSIHRDDRLGESRA